MNNWKKAIEILKKGGTAVVPTDTLYGIVACAGNKKALERIYKIKGRDEGKPFIILITDIKDLEKFGIEKSLYEKYSEFFKPKTSIILPTSILVRKYQYLHRGKKALAFRVISKRNRHLYNLIKEVGPIVAPSANPQGKDPAKNTREARIYFDKQIDLYISGGKKDSKPSTIISLVSGKPEIIRK